MDDNKLLLGVITFVLGQAILKFVLEPIQEQRKIIAEVAFALILYDHALPSFSDAESHSQQTTIEEAKQKYRELAGKLLAATNVVPLYLPLSLVHLVPSRSRALEAIRLLLSVSEELGEAHTVHKAASLAKDRFKIFDLLKVRYWGKHDEKGN